MKPLTLLLTVAFCFSNLRISWSRVKGGRSGQASERNTSNASYQCEQTSLLDRWEYGAEESSNFHSCIINETFFAKHVDSVRRQATNYACQRYQSAIYSPASSCFFLSTAEAFSILAHTIHPGSVVFVGDSLMMQQFIAAKCDVGNQLGAYLNSSLSVHFEWDQYLRPNIPCGPRCIHNASFRLEVQGRFPDPCSGCPEGRPGSSALPPFSSWMQGAVGEEHGHTGDHNHLHGMAHGRWWVQRLPAYTRIIVISTGAWYNSFQGVHNGSEEYLKTLTLLKPIFQRLINSGVMVVWLALPPLVDDLGPYDSSPRAPHRFGWDHFGANNARAFQSFKSMGVIFLDLQLQLQSRKQFDPAISPDGLHWCNVGPTGVPTFINQMIFHRLALAAEKVQHSQRPHLRKK